MYHQKVRATNMPELVDHFGLADARSIASEYIDGYPGVESRWGLQPDEIKMLSEMKEAENNTRTKVGPKSVKITCVHCNTVIKTDTVFEPSMMTHSASIMLIP